MKKHLLLLFIFLSIIVFLLSPFVDKQFAIIPYDVVSSTFYGETHLWCKLIYYGVNVTTFCLAIIPLLVFFLNKKKNIENTGNIKRMMLISYLSLAIGPGLVVNKIFKENWGRARPYQVIRDHHPFSYPWQPHLNRPSDNSFPSGHVSIGAFIGIPFIAARRKKLGITLCLLGTFVVGTARWLQGGHYFTDIIMAALMVWMINIFITYLVDKFFMKQRI